MMDSASKILDIAERKIRQLGYHAVSYRDIAAEIGIKSASLHYHFPKKQDLGVALVARYSDRFKQNLDKRITDKNQPIDRIQAFIKLYQDALFEEKLICLCAVLGAETAGIPKLVEDEVRQFFQSNVAWLMTQYQALGISEPNALAYTTLSLLEGAMIISAVNKDNSAFRAASEHILSIISDIKH